MEVEGKVKKILPIQTFDSGFKKRELILQTEEQYPQILSIEFVQEKTDLLNDLKEGQVLKVFINLRGREWVNAEGVSRYFNTIQGWRIEKIDDTNGGAVSAVIPNDIPLTKPVDLTSETIDEGEDDLPF